MLTNVTKPQIKYGDKEVSLGNEFTPTETKDIPEVHYEHDGGILYTLVMTGNSNFKLKNCSYITRTHPFIFKDLII